MKKLFNYALLAAALLVGVNVNAGNEVSVTIDGTAQPQLTTFADAMDAVADFGAVKDQKVTDGEKDQYKDQEIVITLNKDVAITKEGTTSATKKGWVIARGQNLTIDLNGYNITAEYVRFSVKQSILNIVGKGIIQNTDESINSACLIYVVGTMTDNGYDTKLYIGKDVTIKNSGYAVGAMYAKYTPGKEQGTLNNNYGYGVEITIAGTLDARYGFSNVGSTNFGFPTSIDGMSIPNITLTETGVIRGDDELYKLGVLDDAEIKNFNDDYKKKHGSEEGMDAAREAYRTTASGIYAPGLAIWTINGRVEGGVGIYAKAGKFTINGAAILATSAEYHAPIFFSNGFIGAGSALVFDTNKDYPTAGKGVIIENSTISSDNGFGIEEIWTKSEGVDDPTTSIAVVSGVISGGNGTAISTTPETRDEIIAAGTITGGEWHGTGVENLVDGTKSEILEFTDANGKKYQVVVPIGPSDWSTSIADAAAQTEKPKYAKVTANEDVDTNTKVEFVRIQGDAVVTVKAGKTLDAGTLMTEGSNSKVIVEAGGTLIISGEQGAYTYDENSLVIEASETNSGIVLINPAVVLNTTPKATIEFISKAWRTDANHKVFQRFGLPTGYELSSIVCNTEGGYKTQLDYMDIVEGWVNAGMMESSASEAILEKFNKPFIYCSMLSNNPSTTQMSYTFTGRLAGNTNATLEIRDQFMGYGNSYMGKLNINAMVSALDNLNGSVDATVYAYEDKGAGRMGWNGYGIVDLDLAEEEKNLNPMQPFMLYNKVSSSTPVILNYKDFVWKPVMGEEESASAPRRASRQNMTAANIVLVNAEGSFDKATFAKSESFSSEYESGYDVVKYFDNEDNMSIYFSADQTLATIATNEAHAFVGVSVEKAGEYTIKFNKVRGENLELVDLNNNQHIAIAEGNEYSFYAEGSNDYRFEIIAGAQAPTAMDKVDAKANAVKVISNGEFRIVKDGRTYNAIGAEL